MVATSNVVSVGHTVTKGKHLIVEEKTKRERERDGSVDEKESSTALLLPTASSAASIHRVTVFDSQVVESQRERERKKGIRRTGQNYFPSSSSQLKKNGEKT